MEEQPKAAEAWLDVPGTAGRYQVSDQGRVQSIWFLKCDGKRCKRDVPKIMSQTNSNGYRKLSSLVYASGAIRSRGVHALVLEAFVGPAPSEGHEAAHENGTPSDNRLVNLNW